MQHRWAWPTTAQVNPLCLRHRKQRERIFSITDPKWEQLVWQITHEECWRQWNPELMNRAWPCFSTTYHKSSDKPAEKSACPQANCVMVMWCWLFEGLTREISTYCRREELTRRSARYCVIKAAWRSQTVELTDRQTKWQQTEVKQVKDADGEFRTAGWKGSIMRALKGNAKFSKRSNFHTMIKVTLSSADLHAQYSTD